MKNQQIELNKKLEVIREEHLDDIKFEIKLGEEKDGLCTYFLRVENEYLDLLDKLLCKKDLSEIHLLKNNGEYKTYTGNIPVDMNGEEINLKKIRIARRKYGKGVYYYTNTDNIYTGEWKEGYEDGYGELDKDVGGYKGNMKNGFRRGKGVESYGSGDVFESNYDIRSDKDVIYSLFNGDEYCEGEPQVLFII